MSSFVLQRGFEDEEPDLGGRNKDRGEVRGREQITGLRDPWIDSKPFTNDCVDEVFAIAADRPKDEGNVVSEIVSELPQRGLPIALAGPTCLPRWLYKPACA